MLRLNNYDLELKEDPYLRKRDRVLARKATKKVTFSSRMLELYPGFPGDPKKLTKATMRRDKVGSAGNVQLDEAIHLSVAAWARHNRTMYDDLLKKGMNKVLARKSV